MAAKAAKKSAQELTKRMKDEQQAEIDAAKAKRAEKRKRKAENEFKNMQAQTLSAKALKRMTKKQLRQVKKTRVNKDGVVEVVPAFS